jgi:hypothetical protein
MTCGYFCPVCEGKGFTDEGEVCDYCGPLKPTQTPIQPSIEGLEPIMEP